MLLWLSPAYTVASKLYKNQAKSRSIDIINQQSQPDLSATFSISEEFGFEYSLGFVAREASTLPPTAKTYSMALSNGTVYTCGVAEHEKYPEGGMTPQPEAIREEALQVLEKLPDWCAYRIEGWWTYEVCYGKPPRQYRAERRGDDVKDYEIQGDIKLGRECGRVQYEGQGAAEQSTLEEIDTEGNDIEVTENLSKTSSDKYVWHLCEGGDICEVEDGLQGTDVVGKPRSVEIRYGCGPSARPTLVGMKEPKTCHYMLEVRMRDLCSVPGLADEALPPRRIECWRDTNTAD
jgi:hypothetical protein